MTSVAFHVDQLFAAVPGGIGTYVRELVPAMAAEDPELDVVLFSSRFPSPRLPEAWMDEFPYRRLDHGPRRLYPAWDLLGRPRLPPSLGGLAVLHAPGPAAMPPPGRGQRLVATVHDLAFRHYPQLFPPAWRALYRLGTRRAARTAAAVIAVSASTARDLVRHTRVDPDRVHVVPLAASAPAGSADPEPALARLRIPRPFVLYMGTLEPRKNLIRLVRGYRRAVMSSGLPHALVLSGPLGWRHRRLHGEIASGGPGDVVLTGPVGPEDRDALYRGAELFVYPSLYEGFGLPVLEAMVRGTPTIVSTASSLPEVAGDAAVGVHPRSVTELALAIERVLTDGAEAERLSVAGRARAERFSWRRTARMTLDVYRSVL
ncbi:MAG: glycosyltransferase family 4 protein [Actinomycetota bacterium]|nr:glycosyltransferase family 4 protein [Actinomycetota bacterium]